MVESHLFSYAGRRFNPYGEAAPKRGVCHCKTLAAAVGVRGVPVVLAAPASDSQNEYVTSLNATVMIESTLR